MTKLTKTLTFNEATQVFGEEAVLEICKNKEAELTQDLINIKEEENELFRKFAWCDDRDDWLLDLSLEMLEEKKEKIKGKLRTWQYKKRKLSDEDIPEGEFDKEELKNIPITQVLQNLGYQAYPASKNRTFYKLRENERHASACVYSETNTFYDFGAGVGGDNIALLQWLFRYDFKQACQHIKELA